MRESVIFSGHVTCEMLIKYSSRDVKETAEYTSLEFRGEYTSTLMLFKVVRLDKNK